MQVLIDASMLLNEILKRPEAETRFAEFWEKLQQRQIQGYITETGLNYIYQHICRWDSVSYANKVFDWLEQQLLTKCPVDSEISRNAHGLPIEDYEAAVAVACAAKYSLSAIVTNRLHVFVGVNLQILSVADALDRLGLERLAVDANSVELNQWITGNFSNSWFSLEHLLPQRSNFSFRRVDSSFSAGKQLNLGVNVALVVRFALLDEEVDVWAELWSIDDDLYLSPYLRIEVLDEIGQPKMVEQSDGSQAKIQLNFSVRRNENFSLKVSFGNVYVTETFKS